MRVKYMVLHLDHTDSIESALGRLSSAGWRVRSHVPVLVTGKTNNLISQGERILLEKLDDDDDLSDGELAALATLVQVELSNHEVQARMAAKHGDFLMFNSERYETLIRELKKRGVIE